MLMFFLGGQPWRNMRVYIGELINECLVALFLENHKDFLPRVGRGMVKSNAKSCPARKTCQEKTTFGTRYSLLFGPSTLAFENGCPIGCEGTGILELGIRHRFQWQHGGWKFRLK